MGQHDSNLEIAYHGDQFVIRWHWGDRDIDATKPVSPQEEATIRMLAVNDSTGVAAAGKLADLLGVDAPVPALVRLGGQLRRWAVG